MAWYPCSPVFARAGGDLPDVGIRQPEPDEPSSVDRVEVAPWFRVGRRLSAVDVRDWLILAHQSDAINARPYCVYVHVPFCAKLCSFCALYTHAVGGDREPILDEYLDHVEQSLRVHPWASPRSAPTTVHLGGGTPLFLSTQRFTHLIGALRATFGDAPTCEWAVETTTSSVSAPTVAMLRNLGFRRVHLGIQTLDNGIRSRIGRSEPGNAAIEKIRWLIESGFLVSVDLILGLEGSTQRTVENDLQRLYDAGVEMFSICELRHREPSVLDRGRRREQVGRNYAAWTAIWDFMSAHALTPIHLGQFGRSQDDNLYFTHPARGEDCVAIGPYAHGSCGPVCYANELLPEYYEAVSDDAFPVAFGVLYDAQLEKVRALESELLAHRVRHATLDAVAALPADALASTFQAWIRSGLLMPEGEEVFALSRDGSWLVGNMIAQVRRIVEGVAVRRARRDAPPTAGQAGVG